MKTLFRLGVLLLLCGSAWGAISFHAQTSAIPASAPLTITLPTVSNNDYVICAGASANPATPGTTSLPPFTTPSGWTNLLDTGYLQIIGLLWTTGGASSVTFVTQNGASGGGTLGCISYTGVNASSPIDGVPNLALAGWDNINPTAYILYPSVSPAFTNDLVVSVGAMIAAFGNDPGDPSGFTNRVFRNGGSSSFKMDDKSLGSGSATGNFFSAPDNTNPVNFGALVLLHAASGGSPATTAVQPTYGGIQAGCANFNTMYPATGDLIGVLTFGAGAGTTISGFAKVFQTADVGFFTLAWTAGTSTTITLSGNNSQTNCEAVIVRNYNPSGLTLVPPTVDASGTTTGSVITSLASASIAANTASDLLLVFWSSGDITVSNGNAWTLDAGLKNILTKSFGPETVADGILQAPSNPTGTFTSTIAAAARAGAGAVTFKIATGVTRKRGQVIQVN